MLKVNIKDNFIKSTKQFCTNSLNILTLTLKVKFNFLTEILVINIKHSYELMILRAYITRL